jgi:hypothetical protein
MYECETKRNGESEGILKSMMVSENLWFSKVFCAMHLRVAFVRNRVKLRVHSIGCLE